MFTRMQTRSRPHQTYPPPRHTLGYCPVCELTTRHQQYQSDATPVCVEHKPRRRSMRSVDLWRNNDGTWTGRIFATRYTGRYEEVIAWIRGNGEDVPSHDAPPRS